MTDHAGKPDRKEPQITIECRLMADGHWLVARRKLVLADWLNSRRAADESSRSS